MAQHRDLLTAERLRELLSYDHSTGAFTWKTATRRGFAGRKAGCKSSATGYVLVRVDGVLYSAHRLAWLHAYGVWPVHSVDHVNGDRSDNRLENLRDVPAQQNSENMRRPFKNNRVGLLGVSAQGGKWTSRISFKGGHRHLGTFDTPEAAHDAYLKAKREVHRGCTL